MQCRTCGEHGKEGLSSLDPEQASLLQFIVQHEFDVFSSTFVCHDCVVEIKHWRNFLERFQTSQTLFQQVLKSKQRPDSLQQTDVETPLKLAECRVLVARLLECDSCSFFTNSKSQLETHMQAHQAPNTSEGELKLEIFDIKYEYEYELQPTIPESSNNTFNCAHCKIQVATRVRILKHIKKRHLKRRKIKFNCKQCQFEFIKKENLNLHIKNVHEKIITVNQLKNAKGRLMYYQCTLCSFKSKLRVKVEGHYRMIHSTDRPFVCEICSKGFCIPDHFRNHMKVHEKPKLECKLCHKKFKWPSNLKDHIQYMHDKGVKSDKRLQCDKCNSQFKSRSNLNAHKERAHSHVKYRCKICDISIKSAHYLRVHMRLKHSSEQRFECKMCKKSFSMQWVLNKHNREQHPENRHSVGYECDDCRAIFIKKITLERHIEDLHIFKGSNILYCKHCPAKYRTTNRLKIHVKRKHVENH